MLDLDKESTFDALHEETGVTFTLLTVDPRTYERLQRAAGKGKDKSPDPIAFAGLFAEHAIQAWDKVRQPCNNENKRKFGERFAFNVMPWMVNECMDAARSLDEEKDAAKNG